MGPAIPVILNARAGSTEPEEPAEHLLALFRAAGLEAELLSAGEDGNIVELTRRALRGQPRMVVAGGGDGTVNSVASALAGTEVVLGVLPLGTLNHFARDLRIPYDLEGAVRNLATGDPAPIDVGEVNGHLFLNNSSLGLYPSLVHHREQQRQRLGRGKWTAFLWAALLVLRRYPLLSVRVRVNDTDLVRRTPLVFVSNNVYQMEGLNIGIRERLDAGTLSLYIPRRPGRSGLLRIAIRALFGRLRVVDDFDSLSAIEFQIETPRKHVRVATDGEVTSMATPLRFRIRSGALRVMVPRP